MKMCKSIDVISIVVNFHKINLLSSDVFSSYLLGIPSPPSLKYLEFFYAW